MSFGNLTKVLCFLEEILKLRDNHGFVHPIQIAIDFGRNIAGVAAALATVWRSIRMKLISDGDTVGCTPNASKSAVCVDFF